MNPSFRPVFALILGLMLSPIGRAETTNVSVTIDVVNAKLPVLSVTYGNNSRQLTLADDAAIEIDGKKSDYRALLPGDQAVVTYDKVKSAVTKVFVQRDAIAPAEALAEGWQEIDQRLIFLMIRLANVEASLEAIERAIDADSRKKSGKANTARKSDRDNEALDRKGGGPVKWSQFYGMTAEKFFYHPTDRNTSYHTETVLSQQGSPADNKVGGGVPASQGLPVHQRPPQFDYIYRANDSAKARAEMEASELVGKIDALNERRQRLEAEQAGLWVEIAFRAISHYDLDQKPAYRFEPLYANSNDSYLEKTETMKSAASFMALALSIIGESEKNQQGTFLKLKPAVAKGRQTLNDSFLRLAVDNSDSQSSVGRFVALAKRLDDVSANLTDSYLVATEGDLAGDQQRKDTFRALLQSSLINYAQIILAMDEMAEQMKEECKFRPNVDKSIQFVGLSQTDAILAPGAMSSAANIGPKGASTTKLMSLLEGNDLSQWQNVDNSADVSHWTVRNGVLKLSRAGQSIKTKEVYRDFDLHLEFKLPARNNTGVFLRGRYEVQLVDSLHPNAQGVPWPPIGAGLVGSGLGSCGAIWGQHAPSAAVYKGPNQWNELDVRLIGDVVTIRMNNVTIIESKTLNKVTDGALDHNVNEPGPIILQAHSDPGQEFRNITIKAIKQTSR